MRLRGTTRSIWMTPTALLVCLLGPLALAGCGESEQAKAEKTVCEAKTNISTSVQSLQQLTIQTASLTAVESDVNSISSSLGQMRQAQSKLSGARKEQVQQATETFSAALSGLAHELKSLTLTSAKSQLTAAADKLIASYKQALAPIAC
ncbi:MAG TPA: hypothetical protein VGL57_05670 [Solirubrobacteraceae bacterium]|jgi:hypothetical protein